MTSVQKLRATNLSKLLLLIRDRSGALEKANKILISGVNDKELEHFEATDDIVSDPEVVEIYESNLDAIIKRKVIMRIEGARKIILINCTGVSGNINWLLKCSPGLKHLCINNCELKEEDASDLAIRVQNMKSLEELHMVSDKLVSATGADIAWIVKRCKNLRVLHLISNPLVEGAVSILEAACKSKLRILHIGNIRLGEIKSLPELLYKLIKDTPLEMLEIGDNELKSDSISAIAEALKIKTIKLKALWMRWASAKDDGGVKLAEALEENTSLKLFSPTKSSITDAGGKRIAKMLTKNKTLQILYLKDNAFTHETLVAFADAMKKNTTLHQLGLNRVGFEGYSIDDVKRLIANASDSTPEDYVRYILLNGNFTPDEDEEIRQFAHERKNDHLVVDI